LLGLRGVCATLWLMCFWLYYSVVKIAPPDRIHNLPAKKGFRRHLRRNLTPAEAALWGILRKSGVEGRKFRRQHSVGKYVLDFYCPAERLAVELDGEVHLDELSQIHDRARKRYLNEQGIKVIRFENEFVFNEPILLIERIVLHFGWWKAEKKS